MKVMLVIIENIELTYEGSLVDAKEIERNNMAAIYNYVRNLRREYNSYNGQKYMYIYNIDNQRVYYLLHMLIK